MEYGIWGSHSELLPCGSFRIKQAAQDFVVVERDARGVRVDAAAYVFPGEAPAEVTSAQAYLTTCVASASPAAAERYKEPLTTWLDDTAVRSLEALAAGCSATTSASLGTFTDKDTRSALRCAVRWHYPSLTTSLTADDVRATCDAGYRALLTCLGQDVADRLIRASVDRQPLSVCVPVLSSASREDRRAFHDAFHRCCGAFLHCRVADGIAMISPKRGALPKRPREDATSCYTHMVVEKINVEAADCCQLLADFCGVRAEGVTYAGTKDRRARTLQRMAVVGNHVAKCSGGVAIAAGVRVRAAALRCAPINLGDLSGNDFVVVVRLAAGCDARQYMPAVEQRLVELEQRGMTNYFGPQRFGRLTLASELPGVALCRGDAVAAVEAVLRTVPPEVEAAMAPDMPLDKCRRLLSDRSHRDALQVLDALVAAARGKGVSLTYGDRTNGTAEWKSLCCDAIERVSFPARQLWIHAAQSLIFNCLVSELVSSGVSLPEALPLLGSNHRVDDVHRPYWERVCSRLSIPATSLSGSSIAGVPTRGSTRSSLVHPSHTSVTVDAASDISASALTLAFSLPSSAYATVLLRHVFGDFAVEDP